MWATMKFWPKLRFCLPKMPWERGWYPGSVFDFNFNHYTTLEWKELKIWSWMSMKFQSWIIINWLKVFLVATTVFWGSTLKRHHDHDHHDHHHHHVLFPLREIGPYHLDVAVRLARLGDLKSYAGWNLGPWKVQLCRIGQEVESRKRIPPPPTPVPAGSRLYFESITPSRKKQQITLKLRLPLNYARRI